MELYYKNEKRPQVRVKALDVLSCVLSTNRHSHEVTDELLKSSCHRHFAFSCLQDMLVERIVLPCLGNIETDDDWVTRNKAIQLLVDLAVDCSSAKRCLDVLEVIEKVSSECCRVCNFMLTFVWGISGPE